MKDPRPAPNVDDVFLTQPGAEARASFGASFERIVGLMARLRGDAGCPWDRSQDLASLKPYLIEEAYEVLDALEQGGADAHREELGDLLLQVVFHAEIRREEGLFDAADVAHGIADKLVRRHPHVFGDQAAANADQAFARWEDVKSKEKDGRSVIAGVPGNLPALLRAQRIGEKASHVGFDWPSVDGSLAKLEEEIGELRAAIASRERAEIMHELGDALFSLVNVARRLEVSAEDALRATVDRFARRFTHVESSIRARGKSMRDATPEEMDALWEEAKAAGA